MSAAAVLVALYPPGVRDRWGPDLHTEVAASGIRCWPDTVAGAIRLWLRPSDWPETVAGQTRRTVALMLFALAAAAALVLRAAQPTLALTVDMPRPTSWWLVPVGLGLALAAPLPPLRFAMLPRVSIEAFRVLVRPALAVAAMFALAYSGLVDHPTGALHGGLVCYYWATLGYVAVWMCKVVARIGQVAAAANLHRLRAALWSTGGGAALGAAQALISFAEAPSGATLALVVALGVLGGTCIRAGYDLGAVPSSSGRST